MHRAAAIGIFCLALHGLASAQAGFDVVVLGASGGIQDGNLSAFLIRPAGSRNAVACDAGSIVGGIKVAHERGAFADVSLPPGSEDSVVGHVLKQELKGYLVSHAHLDHIAGLVIASPDDSRKPIYALPSVAFELERSIFNWKAWPNMLDRGQPPRLGKYQLLELKPRETVPLAGTEMTATAFALRHDGTESTAFLIESAGESILCFGDTGPDEVERGTNLEEIWKHVAERVRQKKLKAIIIEVSYTSERPDRLLFGHLTPRWLHQSLKVLEAQAGGAGALRGLPVVVSHIKYSLTKEQPQEAIRRELEAGNAVGVRFVIPEQGARYQFR